MTENMENNLQTKEMRKSKRIEYYSKIQCIKYFFNGSEFEVDIPIEVMLINISVTGLGIISDRKFEDNTILVLNMALEDVLYENISAKVIWSAKTGSTYRHGLQICRLSGRLFSHLSKLDNSVITHI